MSIETDFKSEFIFINSWNNTYRKKVNVIYPKNLNDLKKLLKKIKKDKKKFIIRTGACSYDSKSISSDDETYVISLKRFNKIIKTNKKKKFIIVQSGAIIANIVNVLKYKNLTLHSVPGGEHISVGGAISANAIGKDSSMQIPSFGDAIEEIEILTEKNTPKKLKKNSKEFNKYIGAFGLSGIIIQAKIKIKKIKSKNIELNSKILKNLAEIKKELDKKSDYKYVQIDPFFRKENFSVIFNANFSKIQNNLYKNINLKSYFFEKMLFRISSLFINFFTWKLFYKIFFLLNKNKKYILDIHNYHYPSKYKHMVPLICKDGLIDYELLIKKNFKKTMIKIINFLKQNKLFPIYMVVKKIYGSNKKFYYKFNDNGYAVAISLDKRFMNKSKSNLFNKLLLNQKLNLNLSKSDKWLLKKFDKKNNLFMSLYKKMILENNGISR